MNGQSYNLDFSPVWEVILRNLILVLNLKAFDHKTSQTKSKSNFIRHSNCVGTIFGPVYSSFSIATDTINFEIRWSTKRDGRKTCRLCGTQCCQSAWSVHQTKHVTSMAPAQKTPREITLQSEKSFDLQQWREEVARGFLLILTWKTIKTLPQHCHLPHSPQRKCD